MQMQIPVVDLGADHIEVVAAVREACKWGFFQVINHGSSQQMLRLVASQTEEFFSMPPEHKTSCTTAAGVAGPIHFGPGSGGDWRDVLKMNCAPDTAADMDHWPLLPLGFKDTLMEYVAEQQGLILRLLKIIGQSLGLDEDYVSYECGEHRIVLAINHYLPCLDHPEKIGIREHSDPCTITLLLQDDVPGLQVLKEGAWVDVKPVKDALVVNIGDHLQVLSNGQYPSCMHRVLVHKELPRTSTAMFLSPSLKAYIKPAPSLVDPEHPAKYNKFLYKDFLDSFYTGGGPNKKVILRQFEKSPSSKEI